MNIQKYFFDKNNIPKEDIVFLKSKSQGDLLTPWMILHNMAHAVFEMGNVSSKDAIHRIIYKLVRSLTFGETPFVFPVTEEMAPNVYVNVTLLQPHAQTTNDLPIRLYGVILNTPSQTT